MRKKERCALGSNKNVYKRKHNSNIDLPNEMQPLLSMLSLLGLLVATCSADVQYGIPIGQPSFRANLPVSSIDDDSPSNKTGQEGRFFLTTLTVTFATTTSTSITTISSTCTTSTAALKSCSPSKGRRRRAHLDVGALLYNEEEAKEDINSDIFLIPDKK